MKSKQEVLEIYGEVKPLEHPLNTGWIIQFIPYNNGSPMMTMKGDTIEEGVEKIYWNLYHILWIRCNDDT